MDGQSDAVIKWLPVEGRWNEKENCIVYLGHNEGTQFPLGICVSNVSFAEGSAKVRVAISEQKTEGRLLFGYRSTGERYLMAGIGGWGAAYSIGRYAPGEAWQALRMVGSAQDLEAGREYLVEARVAAQRILLSVDRVPVLEALLDEPVAEGTVGLFAWGKGTVSFTQPELERRELQMPLVEQLRSHAHALVGIVEKDPALFISITNYARELREAATAPRGRVTQAQIVFLADQLVDFCSHIRRYYASSPVPQQAAVVEPLAEKVKRIAQEMARLDNVTFQTLLPARGLWPWVETSRSTGGSKYVHEDRLRELSEIRSNKYDARRLIRLCEELNLAYASGCCFAVGMISRAITDHVPPIFACKNFGEVANNYSGGSSFKKSMQNLENSLKNIADAQLHTQIRPRESLPTITQVDFHNDLDVLLSEVVRKLSEFGA